MIDPGLGVKWIGDSEIVGGYRCCSRTGFRLADGAQYVKYQKYGTRRNDVTIDYAGRPIILPVGGLEVVVKKRLAIR